MRHATEESMNQFAYMDRNVEAIRARIHAAQERSGNADVLMKGDKKRITMRQP